MNRLPITQEFWNTIAAIAEQQGVMVCIVCGCDDENACVSQAGEPCRWIEEFLYSGCASTFPRDADYSRLVVQ